jgi:multisubunit Na+/H+ antiporter MnhB subunit
MAESTATIAFGAVVLLFVLGNRHAAALHWHGRPSLALPDVVIDLVVGFLAVIWISFALCGRLSWSNWFSHRQRRYTG